MFGSGRVAKVSDLALPSDLAKRKTLILSNEEMNDIMKNLSLLKNIGYL